METYVVIALYKFVSLPDHQAIQAPLLTICEQNGIKGTLLLAQEGINGTVAGTQDGIDALFAYFQQDTRFAHIDYKVSYAKQLPFHRMKVRLKKEIVTLGVPNVDPNETAGQYVDPKDWNALISNPDVLVIDTRNDYEVSIGQFKNAIDPKTKTFREFPDYVKNNLSEYKDKPVAMYCTGGIRCEKSTSFLINQGFKEVYHLKGGILQYLEDVPEEESLWEGECFVFDNRVAVDHSLQPGSYDQCHGCRQPITEKDKHSEYYLAGIHCPHCYETRTPQQKQRAAERQHQIALAKKSQSQHLGASIEHLKKEKQLRKQEILEKTAH